MKKLHVDGILESFDFESIGACENFLEMIETPFVGQTRMGDWLIGYCTCWCIYNPLSVAMCGGSFNFIYTLTEDLSGYVHIYLNKEEVWNVWKCSKTFMMK